MMSLLLFALIISSDARAEKPECTMKGITGDCRLYKEKKHLKVITLTDGSSFPNPQYDASAPTEEEQGTEQAPAQVDRPKRNALGMSSSEMQKGIDRQLRVMKIWDSLPKKQRVSDEFKVGINGAFFSSTLAAWAEGDEDAASMADLDLPWPPDKKGARVKTISAAEIVSYLQKLPGPQKQKLKSEIREFQNSSSGGSYSGSSKYGDDVKPYPIIPTGPSATAVQQKRIDDAFDYAKKTMAEEYLKGRKPESLTSEERGQYEKIQTATMMPLSVAATNPGCQAGGAAFYVPQMHQVLLCPSHYNAPTADLVGTFGHEIAHSFDPCCGRANLLRVNQEKLNELARQSSPEVTTDRDLAAAIVTLQNGSAYSVPPYRKFIDGDRVEKRLEELGVIEVIGARVKSDEADPSYQVMQCLERTAFIRPAEDRQLESMTDEMARLMRLNNSESDVEETKKSTLARLREHRHCVKTPLGVSQFSEASSDVWGSRIQGRWLSEHPPKSEEERLAAVFFMGNEACSNYQRVPNSNEALKNLDFIGATIAQNMDQRHPVEVHRLEKNILTEPRLQAALGCKGKPEMNCHQEFGNGSRAATPAAPGVER